MHIDQYEKQLKEHLAEKFDLEESVVEEVLDEISRHVLYCLVFKGESDSVVGRLSFGGSGVTISEQNPKLIEMLKRECSSEYVEKRVVEIISGF